MAQIPRVGSEVTEKWLQEILQAYERKSNPTCSLSVVEFSIKAGSVAGDSFNSDLSISEVSVKIKTNEEGIEEDKHYSLYLKFHSLNAFTKEANKFSKSHIREVLLYSDVYTLLMEYQEKEANGQYPLHIPNVYYCYAKDDEYVIVVDNLTALGYTVSDKKKGLSFYQLELALKELARWHALSYSFNKKTNFLKKFPAFKLNKKTMKFFSTILEVGVTNLAPLIEHNDQYEDILPKIKFPKALMREFLKQLFMDDDSKIRCLIHGDFWNNNLMFKCDSSMMPSEIKVIDWQLSYWGRPVNDIHYLLYSSTTYAVRLNHFDNLLKIYYSTFHDVTTTLECQHPGYTFDAFKEEFMEASSVGLVSGIALSQGTLGKSGEKINPPQTVSPRSLSFNIRCWLPRILIPCMTQPSMKFLTKQLSRKMLGPVGKEVKEGSNKILNERLLGLIVEAHQRGYLNSLSN